MTGREVLNSHFHRVLLLSLSAVVDVWGRHRQMETDQLPRPGAVGAAPAGGAPDVAEAPLVGG
jgi:hypothetical protein